MVTTKYIERKNSIYFSFVLSRRQNGVQSLFSDLYTKQVNPLYTRLSVKIPTYNGFSLIMPTVKNDGGILNSRENPRIFFTRSSEDFSGHFQAKQKLKRFSNESIARARNKILNLALHNCGRELKFLTLTFNEQNYPQNFRDGLLKAQNAMKRLQYRLDSMSASVRDERHTLKYCLIPELGERNKRLHFHAIAIFPYIHANDFALNIWKMGYCQIKTIKAKNNTKLTKAVAGYVAKYISKDCEMLEGRTRIYYASHSWNSDCKKAIFTDKQTFTSFKVLKKMQDSGEINPPRISFINFDDNKPQAPTNDFIIHFFERYPNNDVFPADIIKIELDIPKPKANIFLSLLHSTNIDFYKSDFMRKSPYETKYKNQCKATVDALERILYDFDSLQDLTDNLSILFKNIDKNYIKSVLEDVYYNGGENKLFNNLPLINRKRDLFDLENQTCDKYLQKAAFQRVSDTIDRQERFEMIINRKSTNEISSTALEAFFKLNSKKLQFDRQRRKQIERQRAKQDNCIQTSTAKQIELMA